MPTKLKEFSPGQQVLVKTDWDSAGTVGTYVLNRTPKGTKPSRAAMVVKYPHIVEVYGQRHIFADDEVFGTEGAEQ